MIKLKSLLNEDVDKVSLGQHKVTVRQIDMFYTLYEFKDGTITVYPLDQTRMVNMVDKFGFETVVEPLTNIINNKYGENGFYTLKRKEYEAPNPLTYIFIRNSQ